jgi:predicted RNA binding protein YcfA (HicA-like mRNA interferase family)
VRKFGYRVVHEKGSHIVLETNLPLHQRIVIPDHKRVRSGTLNAILRAVGRHKHMGKDQLAALLM